MIPPQGFRHAATLLASQRTRAIPPDAAADIVAQALARLADDLVALADDMHAEPEFSGWLLAEYERAVERMPQQFDRPAAIAAAAARLARVSSRPAAAEPCDLFLVYVPEDRLPIAGPLAVELVKRRISVAFSRYEVATGDQLTRAIDLGLAHHRLGAVLATDAFARRGWILPPLPSERLRRLNRFDAAAAADLALWARGHQTSGT